VCETFGSQSQSQICDSINGGCEAVERDLHKAREAEAQGLPRRFLRAPHLHQQGLLLFISTNLILLPFSKDYCNLSLWT
jgi:hypothetical protein